MQWSILATGLVLAGAGCLGGGPSHPEPGEDDGSLAWLLPAPTELPADSRAAPPRAGWVEGEPARAGDDLLDWVGIVAGSPKSPSETRALLYEDQRHPGEGMVVVAMRFGSPQVAADWRAQDPGEDRPAGAEGEEDGFAVFYSVCGLRPHFGFLRGNDVVLVLGESADEVPADRVYRAAAGVARAVADRAGGTDLCTAPEQDVNDRLHGDPTVAPGVQDRDAAEAVDAAGLERGPLLPGESNWFSFVSDDWPYCVMVATEDGPLQVLAQEQDTPDGHYNGWVESSGDGWMAQIDLVGDDTVLVRVTAADGKAVERFAIAAVPGQCG